jgi:hypothetical protein
MADKDLVTVAKHPMVPAVEVADLLCLWQVTWWLSLVVAAVVRSYHRQVLQPFDNLQPNMIQQGVTVVA